MGVHSGSYPLAAEERSFGAGAGYPDSVLFPECTRRRVGDSRHPDFFSRSAWDFVSLRVLGKHDQPVRVDHDTRHHVDDAIVVGEDAVTHFERGEDALSSAEGGARRMLAPVVSSSLTTIAAFMPLLLIGGIIGSILRTIPIVVICVILASLVESFLVLPGHLRGTFARMGRYRPKGLRKKLDVGFERFRERVFRPMVKAGVQARWVTVALAIAILTSTFRMGCGWANRL